VSNQLLPPHVKQVFPSNEYSSTCLYKSLTLATVQVREKGDCRTIERERDCGIGGFIIEPLMSTHFYSCRHLLGLRAEVCRAAASFP
jgi:hypothetical protein